MSTTVPLSTVNALAEACAHFASQPWLALDTEFVREQTYFPKLCLVQFGDAGRAEAVDTLALEGAALQPLLDLLAAPGRVKVFHAASQDLEIFVRLQPAGLAPLFDTQLAAALLGDGDQLGYGALVEKRLGVKLDKSLTRTDWSRRPLNAAEIAYALDDVRYLAELYPQLREELAACGRLDWLEEDCARLADPARYRVQPADAWRRLKGIVRLAPPAQATAVALADWRERLAQQRDRPRKWILDDDPLYRIAERRPQTPGQLADLRVLPPKTLEKHGAALLAVVAQAAGSTPPALLDEPPLDGAQKNLLKTLQDEVRRIAESLNVPPGLLGPRADLEALVRHDAAADVPVLAGWRRGVAGDALLKKL